MINTIHNITNGVYSTFTTPGIKIKKENLKKDISRLSRKDFEINTFNDHLKSSIKLTASYTLTLKRFYIIGIGEIILNKSIFKILDPLKEKNNNKIEKKIAEETQSSNRDCQKTLYYMMINLIFTSLFFNKKDELDTSVSLTEMLSAYIYIAYIITRITTKIENILISEPLNNY